LTQRRGVGRLVAGYPNRRWGMSEKKMFEEPAVTSFDREELVIEKAFTAARPSIED